MKNKLLSLFILSVLLIGIVQVTSTRGALKQNEIMFDDRNNDYSSIPEFEPEIQPLETLDSPSLSSFSPSPISFNNMTPEVNMKTVDVEEQRLVVQIDLEKQIVQKGESLKYAIQATKGFEPAVGENLIVEIIEGEYWGWYHYYYYQVVDYNDRTVTKKSITTDASGLYKGEYTFTKNGRYSIVIRSESDTYYKSRSFNVADVGIFWRVSREFVEGQPHYSVAYVLNTSDFSPIAGASVALTGEIFIYDYQSNSYSQYSEELFGGLSDDQGVVDITFTPPENLSNNYHFLANLSITIDGETSYILRDLWQGGYYWTIDGYQEFSPYEFIVTTDKPIYSPRETIQARILLWENDYLKATKKPAQTSFTLKILTPSQHIIYQKDVKTDIYGIATYSFTLDSESELGTYQIITQIEEVITTTEVRVDKYEKPAFKVDLTLDKEFVPPGKTVSGVVTATYYFGKPVTQAQIELVIGGLTTLTGTTDKNGVWIFSYTLPKYLEESGLYTISINATVTDLVNREVIVSSSLQIVDNVYVYAWVNPWFPKADENITVHFGAYQYSTGYYSWWNWQPLAEASVNIKLYAMLSSSNSYYITSFHSQTGTSGNGQYQFTVPLEVLPYTTRFKGVIELDTDDGREGTSTFYFSVDLSKVEASISSETFSVGEKVELNLILQNILTDTSIAGNVKIRVFDADYELIGEVISEVSESGKIFSFELSPYSPTGDYYIYIYVSKTFTYEWGSYSHYKYSDTVYFSVGPSQRFILSLDKPKYSLSDSMTITGIVEGDTNAPVMIQFVKKGILTTQFVPKDHSALFSITISDLTNFAPKVWIYGFVILSNGRIQEQRLFVEIDSTIIVEISSDKESYAPGETAQIDIQVYDANRNPVSTVMAVSFIDSSVFGVEPDPENENEYFSKQDYWPSVWTVTSWKNRQSDWWFWWYDDFHTIGYGQGYYRGGFEEISMMDSNDPTMTQAPESGEKSVLDAQEEKAIRDNLPENAYWKPLLIVKDGSLSITLDLPDTIGEWTVRVVATTSSGVGVLEKYTFQTFLPFFVEIIKDPFVLQDDVFIIKGVVYNYLGEILNIDVSIETVNGIIVLGHASQKLRLPSEFLGSIAWACLAEDTGYLNVTIYASTTVSNGTKYSDALRKSVEIVPNGIEVEFKDSNFISSEPSFDYERFSDSVQQTEFLELSLGLGSTAISSWERLVGYPYGCTEQTISRLIPDALILDYLNQTGQLTNDTKELLNNMITTGLSRLYSQQHPDGGWGWWSSDSSRVYMTSLVLLGLSTVKDIGFYVDPSVVRSAISALLSRQNVDGSWTPDSWRSIDKVAFTAFVLRSVIFWSTEWSDVTIAANYAIDYISSSWSDSTKQSSYLAALYLDAVHDSSLGSPAFESLLVSYLVSEVQLSSEGNYWHYSSSSTYWWRALGGDVEITALALKALVLYEPASHMPTIRGAIQWILQKQSRYGWGNTADTAAAISSLITISQEGFSFDEDVTVTINLNGEEFRKYNLSTSDEPIVYLDMEDYIKTGVNTITFTKSGSGNVSYYFYGKQVLRALPTIELPSKVTAIINQDFNIPVKLTPTSSTVFARNLTIDPIEGDINPNPNLPYITQLLTQETQIIFNYNTPSKEGVYIIPGFEISYQLSDSNQVLLSPGLISRRYGPIELTVLDSSEKLFPAFVIQPESTHQFIVRKISKESTAPEGVEFTRSFSKESFIKPGELIFVSLEINNENDTLNFIMVEDSIPSGFKLDPSTIQHPTEMYEVTNTGITFFFPELSFGLTKIKYGLIASNIRQSLVIPAQLSSMYDDWMVKSTPGVLGEARLSIDPMSGQIAKDLIFPEVVSLELKEIAESFSTYLQIQVVTEDNWGVATVKVFIQQNTWIMLECFSEEGTWSVNALGLHDGAAQIYLEIMDYAGNIYISSESVHMLELDDFLIPIIPMTFLLVTALLSGVGISFFVRKRGI